MVTSALGLDANICEARGIRLMVSQGDQISLGLRAARAFDGGTCGAISTVKIVEAYGDVGPLFYDIRRTILPAEDEVVGVWIPTIVGTPDEMLHDMARSYEGAIQASMSNERFKGASAGIWF